MVAAAALVAAACSEPTGFDLYPGTSCPVLEVVSWSPAGFSTGAPTDRPIRLTFDDYPDPDTFGSDSLLLTTGFFWVPGTYRIDLLTKSASLHPWRPLVPDLGYTIHLSDTVRSLAGCAARAETRSFRTGSGPAGTDPDPVPSFAEVQEMLADHCGGSGCHLEPADPAGGCVVPPAGGLSLCAADAWAALVDVPARQAPGLRRVLPGDSSRSHLLRKLLPVPREGPPPPTTTGHRNPSGSPLAPEQLRSLARWIDGGALP